MKKKPVIAIDGYSSTGKSSISKVIAKKLGLIHLDTGALYRGITLFALRNCSENGIIIKEKLIESLPNIRLDFKLIDEELILFLNNENIAQEIRFPEVSAQVSFVAKQPEVREFLLEMQREMARNGGIIMDGRDIGTVVLPDAEYKFFLTASVDERTRRRHRELLESGQPTDEQSVKDNLILRDKIDSERATAPLRQAADAVLVDNTNMDKDQTVEYILSFIN